MQLFIIFTSFETITTLNNPTKLRPSGIFLYVFRHPFVYLNQKSKQTEASSCFPFKALFLKEEEV
jgi:hypothetical protein